MAGVAIADLMAMLGPSQVGTTQIGQIGKPPPPAPWQNRYAVPNWRAMLTKLTPKEEAAFQQWAAATKAPITDDYDMRGFWKSGGTTAINQNDGMPHYTDTFKTPLHQTFSGESRYARPKSGAPMWNDRDQLVLPNGVVVFDERAK